MAVQVILAFCAIFYTGAKTSAVIKNDESKSFLSRTHDVLFPPVVSQKSKENATLDPSFAEDPDICQYSDGISIVTLNMFF